MKFINRIKDKKIVWTSLIILVALFIFLLIYNRNSYANVYYRTYTKEDGWTGWNKNGETCGTKNNISAIEIKIKSNVNGNVIYKSYYDNDWEENEKSDSQQSGNKKNEMNSIRIKLDGSLKNEFDIKYRTKNTDKEWTVWLNNYLPVFYSEETKYDLPIKKIQIKLEKK